VELGGIGHTPLARHYGLTVEDWAEYGGAPDHVWSNIRRHHADEEPGWGPLVRNSARVVGLVWSEKGGYVAQRGHDATRLMAQVQGPVAAASSDRRRASSIVSGA
jgi:hypothetical protein